MLRAAIIMFLSFGMINVSAIKCSDVKAKGRPLTLSEKYCDSDEEKSEDKEQTSLERDAQLRQQRQERFLGANPHLQQQLKGPATTSEPGFKLPEPFVPPAPNKSGKWDYLK